MNEIDEKIKRLNKIIDSLFTNKKQDLIDFAHEHFELLEENERLKQDLGLSETAWKQQKDLRLSCEIALEDRDKQITKLEAINKQLLEEIKELKTELQRWESGERNYEQ